MSTREKILVGLMIVAVCLGALVLFSEGQNKTASKAAMDRQNPLSQMLTRLAAQYGNGSSLENDRYTLSMARSPWSHDLFPEGAAVMSAAAETPGTAKGLPANMALVYTGFIETPQRRVAIINGIEYVVGDQLDKSDYTVRHIDPSQVVLASPQQELVSIPLVESWEVQAP
jgi:hypothetical protein